MKKVVSKKESMTLERLATLMAEGFNDVNEHINEVDVRLSTQIAEVDERLSGQLAEVDGRLSGQMASLQEQIVAVHYDIRSIKEELRQIDRRLDALEASVRDVRGYAKEIDELRARVRRMEEYLATHGHSFV